VPTDPLASPDPFSRDDIMSMTHQPETPNPVPGIVKPAIDFMTSGDMTPAHKPGTQPKDYLRELAQNPDIMEKNIEQASNLAGMAGTTKPPRYMLTSPEGKKYILAYHGSPHDFDRFDFSKIGTGEGAQAYGHGGYFAENEGVARDYRDKLSGGARFAGDNEGNAILALKEANGDRPAAIKSLKEFAEQMRARNTASSKFVADSYERSAEMLEKGWEPPKGKMYKVAIKANPEHFLDWDRPLSEQHPKVQKALGELGFDVQNKDTLGQHVPGMLGSDFPNISRYPDQEKASQTLRQAGIPGIKYLDEGSRNIQPNARIATADEVEKLRRDMPRQHLNFPYYVVDDANGLAGYGTKSQAEDALSKAVTKATSNYVVFDDKMVDIIKKYGWAGLGLPAIGAARDDRN
jgi:hypothetical protein